MQGLTGYPESGQVLHVGSSVTILELMLSLEGMLEEHGDVTVCLLPDDLPDAVTDIRRISYQEDGSGGYVVLEG